MAIEINIYETCRACAGTGIDRHSVTDEFGFVTYEELVCAPCSGNGKVVSGTLIDGALGDIIDKIDDIKNKLDNTKDKCDAIKEKCDQIWDKVK